MIENVDDPTEIKRYRDVVEISQSMFAGNYDDLRNNRKIETENFMMAATFTRTKIKREDLLLNRKLNTSKNKIKLQNKIINRWNIMPL